MITLRARHFATILIAGAASISSAQQQPSFPTNDAVLERIWRLGMDSSHVQQLSQALFDSIGPRLTGGPGLKAASDWAINEYKSWGIDAKREQYGTWRGWRRGPSHIDLVSPRVRSLEGTMLGWSPGTNGKPVTAPVITLPKFRDSTEFVKWLPQARGKFVMLSPAWPTCRPSEDWYRWATPASMARMDTLIAQMQEDWAVDRDSTKLYRGTGYSLALGTGSLGLRLEKAGVVGMITSRTKLSGFPNPLNPNAGGFGGRGGRGGGRGAGGPASARGGGGPGASMRPGRGEQVEGTGGWGVIEVFETYDTKARPSRSRARITDSCIASPRMVSIRACVWTSTRACSANSRCSTRSRAFRAPRSRTST